jgi:hypothetical protein
MVLKFAIVTAVLTKSLEYEGISMINSYRRFEEACSFRLRGSQNMINCIEKIFVLYWKTACQAIGVAG